MKNEMKVLFPSIRNTTLHFLNQIIFIKHIQRFFIFILKFLWNLIIFIFNFPMTQRTSSSDRKQSSASKAPKAISKYAIIKGKVRLPPSKKEKLLKQIWCPDLSLIWIKD